MANSFSSEQDLMRQLGEQGPRTQGTILGLALEAKAEEGPLIPRGEAHGLTGSVFFFRDGEPEEATDSLELAQSYHERLRYCVDKAKQVRPMPLTAGPSAAWAQLYNPGSFLEVVSWGLACWL